MFFFFFNDTATTEIYTLSLHDALPICGAARGSHPSGGAGAGRRPGGLHAAGGPVPAGLIAADRKSTRLNSSHGYISYAVFCLKKKKADTQHHKLRRRGRTADTMTTLNC